MHNIINDNSLVLGLMSGTSMDGLDISCATYSKKEGKWNFDLIATETFLYHQNIKTDFIKAFYKELNLDEIDVKFGHVLSDYIEKFLKKHNLTIDLISSHGHTIFHKPEKKYTKQIGLGSIIAKRLNVPVVSNFRQQDINLGGQGAPLVPVGDSMLFNQYESCINLGGIANISLNYKGDRLAYDISPCNMILNYLSRKEGRDFDKNGIMASKGSINNKLLNELNKINYYELTPPKSLGKEHVESFFLSVINSCDIDNIDLLATLVEHIAIQITNVFSKFKISNCFFTGGGTFNDYLISRISFYTETKLIIPSAEIINFKESIIFGFLGVLRILNQNNCLASSTGASHNHSSGDIYLV